MFREENYFYTYVVMIMPPAQPAPLAVFQVRNGGLINARLLRWLHHDELPRFTREMLGRGFVLYDMFVSPSPVEVALFI